MQTEHVNGDTVTLTCAAVGADRYTFYITGNDGSLITLSNEKQMSNTYVIDPFLITNIGMYTCKAYNGDIEAADPLQGVTLTLAGMLKQMKQAQRRAIIQPIIKDRPNTSITPSCSGNRHPQTKRTLFTLDIYFFKISELLDIF